MKEHEGSVKENLSKNTLSLWEDMAIMKESWRSHLLWLLHDSFMGQNTPSQCEIPLHGQNTPSRCQILLRSPNSPSRSAMKENYGPWRDHEGTRYYESICHVLYNQYTIHHLLYFTWFITLFTSSVIVYIQCYLLFRCMLFLRCNIRTIVTLMSTDDGACFQHHLILVI